MFGKNAKHVTIFLILFQSALVANPLIPNTALQEKIDIEPSEDELIVLERLIQLTEKQMEAQKVLKKLITNLKQEKELFLKGDQSKMHAFFMIQSAKKSLKIIRAYHLEHLFSSDFMEELALFSQVGKN